MSFVNMQRDCHLSGTMVHRPRTFVLRGKPTQCLPITSELDVLGMVVSVRSDTDDPHVPRGLKGWTFFLGLSRWNAKVLEAWRDINPGNIGVPIAALLVIENRDQPQIHFFGVGDVDGTIPMKVPHHQCTAVHLVCIPGGKPNIR